MRIVVTGSAGFIGRNLCVRLTELGYTEVACLTRETSTQDFKAVLQAADIVFHLAGVNRSADDKDFTAGNVDYTADLCAELRASGRAVPIVYTSSTQASTPGVYGTSKLQAEEVLSEYGRSSGAAVWIYRLSNTFGKWARPNYNSVVATFCHNVARSLPITVTDASKELRLVYIDDVVSSFVELIGSPERPSGYVDVEPVYSATLGEIASTIKQFEESRQTLTLPAVGTGLTRALYSTYVSALPRELFAYQVPVYSDPRGSFAEFMKTPGHGQFSYFTGVPGVTRGEHYHHSKTEKFVVIQGKARFRFRQIVTNEGYELDITGGEGHVVETVPGWAHDITNIGDGILVVMLWANEIFDRAKPDTISAKVVP